MPDIVSRVIIDTSEAMKATLAYSQAQVKLQAALDKTAAAQAKMDEALAASGAGSAQAVRAQTAYEAALRKTTVAEAQVGIAAQRSAEIQAAAANRAAAAQEAAAAKQAAALKKVGTAAGLVGGLIAVGFGVAAKSAADFDAKLATFQSLSGASASQMQRLVEAGHGFTDLGIDASESADAMIELTKAGLSVSQILGGGLKASLILAADGQIAVADATEIMASAMVQFKLPAQDAAKVADDLAAGADKALGSVQDLGEGLKYAGLGAHQAGLSLDETVGALAEFAQAGLIGSMGGTTLQQVLRQMLGPTQSAALEMQELGIQTYDAQGHFIGLAGYAKQLQDKLGGLSEADRNAALNTLFTSRAVRGATILYQDGARGVNHWVREVNDSGFAARQAAGKMDSLQGDLQKLGAVIQNDLIDVGQQLQPVLRTITKDLTTLGNILGEIPDPVKSVAAEFGVVVAALGLGFWAFTRLKGAAVSLAETLGVLSGAQVEVGTTAATMAAEEDVAAASMAGASKASAGGLLGRFNKGGAARLGGGLALLLGGQILGQIAANQRNDSIPQGAASAGSYAATGAGLGLFLGPVGALAGGGFGGLYGGLKYAHDHPGPVYRAPTNSFRNPQFTGNFTNPQQFTGGAAPGGGGAALLALQQHPFQVSAAQSTKVLAQLGVTGQQTFEEIAAGAGHAAVSLQSLEGAAAKAWKTMLSGEQSVLARRGDFRSYQQAIDDASAALKQNGKTLDVNTQAGRDNQASLDNLASTASSYAQTISDPILQLKFLQSSRDQLLHTAESFGMTQKQALAYTNQVLGIPKEVRTEAQFEKNAAYNDIKTYEKAIDSVPGFKNTVITAQTEQAEQALGRVHGDLLAIQSKSVWVTVGTRYVHSGVQAGGYATGGLIGGRGTGTSDSNLIRASRGEFMQPKQTVDHYGLGMMEAIRNRTYPKAPGFAGGGSVGRMSAPSWQGGSQTVVMSDPNIVKRLESIEARLAGGINTTVTNAAEVGGASRLGAHQLIRANTNLQENVAMAQATR
jgi:TP901 family phage tail tape measure protein